MRRRLITLLLSGVVVLGLVPGIMPGSASAQTQGVAALAGAAVNKTRGFWIDNLSTKKMKLTQVQTFTGQTNAQLLPVGHTIYPGETAHSELDAIADTNSVRYSFDLLDSDDTVYSRIMIGMVSDALGIRYQSLIYNQPVKKNSQKVVSPAYHGINYAWVNQETGANPYVPYTGQNIAIYDPQGSVYDGTTLSPTSQGGLLDAFCSRDAVTCKFIKKDPPGELKTRSMPVYLGDEIPNSTCDNVPASITTTDSRTTTHSWEFSLGVKGGVKDVWETQFTAKYGGSVANSTGFQASKTMTVRPGFIGYFASTVPVYHWNVRWLVEVRLDGSGPVMSTITVNGTVDIPDGTTTGGKATVEPVANPMTDQERSVIQTKCKPLPDK